MSLSRPIILVAGPTAAGKSHYAQELALVRGGEIINADSQQFYRGLDIGTGKLPLEERKVAHWLYDVCPPGGLMTAMEFARMADECIAKLQAGGKTPIIVGGTGLYIRALLEGLDPLPPRDTSIRRSLEKEWEQGGGAVLHEKLSRVDPVGADRVPPEDKSRLIRYLEIHALTGRPASSLMKRGRPTSLRYVTETHFLCPARIQLRAQIAERVRQMVAGGWREEVRSLINSRQDPRSWKNKPIGYADMAGYLEGDVSLEDTVEKIILKTRQYAKRQDTFFKGLFRNPAYESHGSRLTIIRSQDSSQENSA